jgi:hypothetical protein
VYKLEEGGKAKVQVKGLVQLSVPRERKGKRRFFIGTPM